MVSNLAFPGLKCPECGEEGTLSIRLEDGSILCGDCEETLSVEQIEQAALNWSRLLEFLKRSGALDDRGEV